MFDLKTQITHFDNLFSPHPEHEWIPFSDLELMESLKGCSGSSAPGSDHITWNFLKVFMADPGILSLFMWIANACLTSSYWPAYFKTSMTVIIPKPNKLSYNIPKAFRPIVF